jgi:hypothetical protein
MRVPSLAVGRLDIGWPGHLHPFRYGRLWIGLAPEYEPAAPTMLFVARYRGDQGDPGYLRYETLRRLTPASSSGPD